MGEIQIAMGLSGRWDNGQWNYGRSVCLDVSDGVFVFTSPTGNMCCFWNWQEAGGKNTSDWELDHSLGWLQYPFPLSPLDPHFDPQPTTPSNSCLALQNPRSEEKGEDSFHSGRGQSSICTWRLGVVGERKEWRGKKAKKWVFHRFCLWTKKTSLSNLVIQGPFYKPNCHSLGHCEAPMPRLKPEHSAAPQCYKGLPSMHKFNKWSQALTSSRQSPTPKPHRYTWTLKG